ncbi:MAG: DUF6198 family protein [Paludibacteraceae bacterium]
MKKDNLAIRSVILLLGIFVMAFGVALSIRSSLGTTPISSLPYVYNYIFPSISVGTLTILMNSFFVVLQMLILKNDFKVFHLIQIPIVVVFGWFIDLHLHFTKFFNPDNYIMQWIFCLVSCLILAFGVFLQVKADISFLPGEGLVMAISRRFNKEFGGIKIFFDSLLVILALISSLILLDGLHGVREGTIVSALIVGFIVQFYQRHIRFVDVMVSNGKQSGEYRNEPYMTTDKFVITISREYGSGGHAVGEQIAKKLGITFYDSKLIDLTAKASGFTPEYVKENEQKLSNTLLYQLYKQNYAYVNEAIPPRDMLFMVQTKVIRDIAARESCVIVGRSANFILKGHPNCFNVFIHADKAFRINRVISDYGIDPDDAAKEMEKKDYERANYNKYYTGYEWQDLNVYDLTVESSLFGIEITAAMIIDARRKSLYAENN